MDAIKNLMKYNFKAHISLYFHNTRHSHMNEKKSNNKKPWEQQKKIIPSVGKKM